MLSANAFAYDTIRSQSFFIDPHNRLQFWDRGSTLAVLATPDQFGLAPTGSQPCDAAYDDHAYWHFTEGTNVLNKVSCTYTDEISEVLTRKTFVVSGAPSTTASRRSWRLPGPVD